MFALGARRGEEGGLGRLSEVGCGCDFLLRYVVFGNSGGRSVSESDMGSKKSDGSWDWDRLRGWVARPLSMDVSSSMPIRAMRSLSIPVDIRDDLGC